MKKNFLMLFLILLVIIGVSLIFVNFNKKDGVNQLNKITQIIPQKNILPTGNVNQPEREVANQGLTLEIISPKNKETVASSLITISGKTSPNAEVFVNEKQTKANAAGDFSLSYEVLEGENEIYVTANDEEGNYAEKMITVYLETNE